MDHHLTAVCPIFNCNVMGSRRSEPQRWTSPPPSSALLVWLYADRRPPASGDPAPLEVHASHACNPLLSPLPLWPRPLKAGVFPRCWAATAMASRRQRQKDPGSRGTRRHGQAPGSCLTRGDLGDPPVPTVEVPRPQPAQENPTSTRPTTLRTGGVLDKGTMAPSRAYGVALRALGHAYPHLVALDAVPPLHAPKPFAR